MLDPLFLCVCVVAGSIFASKVLAIDKPCAETTPASTQTQKQLECCECFSLYQQAGHGGKWCFSHFVYQPIHLFYICISHHRHSVGVGIGWGGG